jgi:branched-chain amino acid aminotransferase
MNLKIDPIPPGELKGGVVPGQIFDFGKAFSDRMLTMQYAPDQGWHDAHIGKFDNFSLSPATMCLHYGQLIFEGLKAYRRQDGRIGLFRARDNFARMNESAERMCMPVLDIEETYDAMAQLIALEKDWVPHDEGASLYIRPTMIATDPLIRLKASSNYLFYIICSPVGHYYANGMKPTAIIVEDSYVRAVRGGVGFAKTAANYATSLLPGKLAEAAGYDQVLWLDGVNLEYVEEVGSMNIFFKYKDRLVTSELNGSILPGITRDSVIQIAQSWGVQVDEEKISIRQLCEDIEAGSIEEMFGTGTAAVISSVGTLRYKNKDYTVGGSEPGAFSLKMYAELTGIQYGRSEDRFGWTTIVA